MNRGQSLIISPLFDGTNYAYWKVRMKAFLQALDEKVWLVVEVGWKKTSRALNALFNGMTNEEFMKISSIEIIWMILLTIKWHLSLINKCLSHSHFNSLPKQVKKNSLPKKVDQGN